MKEFLSRVEEPLLKIMNSISSQRHLKAVRDGLVATIPITVLGAIFLLIPTFPFPKSYVDFIAANPDIKALFYIPFNMTLGLLSVYSAYAIGSRMAQDYEYDALSGGISAVLTFLVTMKFTSIEGSSYLSTTYLGGSGIFTAILASILAVEVMHFCKVRKITIKLPEMVPPNVGASFEFMIPIFISATLSWLFVHVAGVNINQLISTIITPILSTSSDSILTPIIYVLLTAAMWFLGIHPGILAAIMTPVWLVNAEANMAAVAVGQAIPHIGVRPFIFTFLWIGGGGGTLALAFLMSFSKSKVMRNLGRISVGPGLFNINEPIIFGLPIVFNPILIIPFTLAPLVCVFTTYFAFTLGLVPGMGYPLAAVWNLPSVLAGFVSTASISGALLVLFNFTLMGLIYYPFFKIYEKRMVALESVEAEVSHE